MSKTAAEQLADKLGSDGFARLVAYKLADGENVTLNVTGDSMLPFLADGRDTVTLKKIERLPRKGDIVLYQRSSGAYVLHRVVKRKKGALYFSGDAQTRIEGPIAPRQLIGVCQSVCRNGKTLSPRNAVWIIYKHRFFKTKRFFDAD